MKRLLLFLAGCSCLLRAGAQTPSPADPNALAATLLANFNAAQHEFELHYGYITKSERRYIDGDGKILSKSSSEFDLMPTADYRNVRAFRSDGKKQNQRQIAAFNDEYAASRSALQSRWTAEASTVARPSRLPALLATKFLNTIVGHEPIDGIDCIVFDARPGPDLLAPNEQKRIRLWADAATLMVLQYRVDFLQDEDISGSGHPILAGSTATTRYAYVGVWALPLWQTVENDFVANTPKAASRLVDRTDYSHYQRYDVTVTIHPGTTQP